MRRPATAALILLMLALPALGGEKAKPPIGEASVSFEAKAEDFVLRQYELPSLAHLSYLVGSRGVGLVVDPQRDVAHYVRDAEALGLEIKTVILTHTHGDFVAGHEELRSRTGARILTCASCVESETQRTLGAARVVLQRAPAGLMVLVFPGVADSEPAFALTGDALLVGTVGCPEDLGAGTTPMRAAEQAFDGVQLLKMLPDDTKILPAHGAGRFCGRKLEPYTVSTMARERTTNPFLKIESRAAFVAGLLALRPDTPAAYGHVARLNREGPPLVDWKTKAEAIAAANLPSTRDAWIVDVRTPKAYAAGHVLGAVNIAVKGPIEPWTAAVVPVDAPLYLIGSDEEVERAVRRLHRIGYSVRGRLDGGMAAWKAAGKPIHESAFTSPAELMRLRDAWIEPLLVDVRSAPEHAKRRIPECVNVPLERSARLAELLEPSRPLLMVCKSGYRSSIAVGLAERRGFTRVGNLAGGVEAWAEAGLPLLPAPEK